MPLFSGRRVGDKPCESCFPGKKVNIWRGQLPLLGMRKTKRCQNERFQTRHKTFTGWAARIIQHEIDCHNGILI